MSLLCVTPVWKSHFRTDDGDTFLKINTKIVGPPELEELFYSNRVTELFGRSFYTLS